MRLAAILLSLVLPLVVLGHSPSHVAARHAQLAKRASGDISLHKRYSDARWTFYDVGLGACGKYNVASDYIVALNSAQYGGGYPGPNCFKTITMTYNGKTAQATIMDECPGCPWGGLDLSRGLFTHFAAESVGVLYGTWTFNDGSGSGSDPAPATTTKHTSTYVAPKTTSTKKTTTWEPAPTTTKKSTTSEAAPKTTSTSHSHTSSSTTSSDSTTSSSTASSSSSSAAPSSTSSATPGSNFNILATAFEDLGQLVLAAAAAE